MLCLNCSFPQNKKFSAYGRVEAYYGPAPDTMVLSQVDGILSCECNLCKHTEKVPAQFSCLCGKSFPNPGQMLFTNLCPECNAQEEKCPLCKDDLMVNVGKQGREIIAYCLSEKGCKCGIVSK